MSLCLYVKRIISLGEPIILVLGVLSFVPCTFHLSTHIAFEFLIKYIALKAFRHPLSYSQSCMLRIIHKPNVLIFFEVIGAMHTTLKDSLQKNDTAVDFLRNGDTLSVVNIIIALTPLRLYSVIECLNSKNQSE